MCIRDRDINEGPLARAQEHIRAARLEEYIQTRLSDGAEALLPNEADSILIAGMGGEPVSYTHLDVYKRQICNRFIRDNCSNLMYHLCVCQSK